MAVTFSEVLASQRELFDRPPEERTGFFLQHVLEPIKTALMPPPGMGPADGDLLAFARQFGFLNPQADPDVYSGAFSLLDVAATEHACRQILQRAEAALAPEAHGIMAAIAGHVVIADPECSQALDADDGYTGYGGHSGHAIVHANVSERNITRIPAALAHEYHHNIRLRFEPWTKETTVGQYAILEGLAEAFAVELCGEEYAGPWVTRQTAQEREHARRILGEALEVTGWNEVRSYVFGDWVARTCGQPERGLVRSAGYAVGYDCVRAYCAATGTSVAQATYVPWREIAEGSGCF
jgi:uncharacterized protein YjaZ